MVLNEAKTNDSIFLFCDFVKLNKFNLKPIK